MVDVGNSDQRLTEVIVNRILLVEDEADTAEFIKTLLEKEKYSVLVAKDGGQGQSMFVMKQPDFVILDLILPGESGFEVCERFKTTDRNIPVLILSAIDMEDAFELGKRVGADAYLTKPFEPKVLLQTIKDTAQAVWARTHVVEEEEPQDSRVRFSCRCGKKFKVSSSHRGKSLNCPNCGNTVVVPRHD